MKNRIFLSLILGIASSASFAQETYQNAILTATDLNGTARYVGMGGAMDALGADISTINTNPAGIGIFRRSSANLSLSVVNQQEAVAFGGGQPTHLSFDQLGLVWSNQVSSDSYVNFALNYHKSRNFNQLLSVVGSLDNASQNKATTTKLDEGILYPTYTGKDGKVYPDFDNAYTSCTILDDLYSLNLNNDESNNSWHFYNGELYAHDIYQSGYISNFDFNLSGSVDYHFFWGITMGFHDVHYNRYSEYSENLIGGYGILPVDLGVTIADDRIITGFGYDITAGAIFMPVEECPLRFGVAVSTPTFYDLKTSSHTTYNDNTGWSASQSDEYDFRFNTPWKFNLSAGHVIGSQVALGLGYEYADYSSIDSRIKDGGWDYESSSYSDTEMNRHTEATLRGVHTVKAGAEFRPAEEVAVRIGYNFVSPAYEKKGIRDTWVDSPGSYHSSTTDFTNWKATHRLTCGVGLQLSNSFNLSAAYQYSIQKGNYYPFDSYTDDEDPDYDNIVDGKSISLKRHQVMLTATVSF